MWDNDGGEKANGQDDEWTCGAGGYETAGGSWDRAGGSWAGGAIPPGSEATPQPDGSIFVKHPGGSSSELSERTPDTLWQRLKRVAGFGGGGEEPLVGNGVRG